MSLNTYLIAAVTAAFSFYGATYFVAQGYLAELGLSSDYQQYDFKLGHWGWIAVTVVFLTSKYYLKSKSSLSSVVSGVLAGFLFTLAYVISELSWLQFNVLESEMYFPNACLAALVSYISAVVFNKSY